MRIAMVAGPHIPIPPPNVYGGTEQVVHFLTKGLTELGHEVLLLGPGDSTANCEIIPITDKALYFPADPKDLPEHLKLIDESNKKTKKILKKLQGSVDIIHSHGFDLLPFKDQPNITTHHGKIDFEHLQFFLDRQELYFVSISNNQQQSLPVMKWIGVVYNGEDPAQFPTELEPQDYLCFLGRFDREKNPHLAIQLAINLNMKIKLAGKVDFQGSSYFKEEVEHYFAHPLVEFLGEIGVDKKIELLKNARCNLHPTGFREPFGLTVLEAAYCGTPTLAIERGSMPELIEDGRTGILVEDYVEGYDRIQQCFEMDRQYISTRARMLFNHETMSKQYLKAYQAVLDIFSK